MSYQDHIIEMSHLIKSNGNPWDGIDPEAVARMRVQNRFQTGLDIARYTAGIMRARHGRLRRRPLALHPVAGLPGTASSRSSR